MHKRLLNLLNLVATDSPDCRMVLVSGTFKLQEDT